MIRLAIVLAAAYATVASSFAFVPFFRVAPHRTASLICPLSPAAKSDRHNQGGNDEKSFLDKALGFFQDDEAPKKEAPTGPAAAFKAALGIQDDSKEKKGETAFDRHRAAAKDALKDASEAITSVAETIVTRPDDGEQSSADVDEKLLNRLRVHAEKILSSDEGTIELLGGEPVAVGKILSYRPSTIVVDGGRKTDGIRAFVEVSGPKRSGTALLVGDRRGVLLLKLTVGGQTLDVRMEEGLDQHVAHGVKKLQP